jgi:benzylsuccinate CoA-transferase BbsF subunit
MNGYLGEDAPVKSGVNFGDPISGAHAAGAVLSALYRRRRTGKGAFIDASQLESSISVVGEHIIGYQMDGQQPSNRGNRHPVMAPHGAYPCRGDDKWITIAVSTDDEWARLCEVMDRTDLADDERFADLISRLRNQDTLDEVISSWTAGRDPQELAEALQREGIASSPVMTGEDIFNDPHYQERGLLELVDHPSAGMYFLPGVSWKMSATPGSVRWPAPRLGEHNDFVFSEVLGMTASDIARLDEEGVTGTEPIR